jgi:Ssp1 endopeptidase immunity protein Rap1a
MMRSVLLAGFAVLMALTSIEKAVAVEPLSTKELAEHCIHYAENPTGEDAIFCVRYVQGFIDGAVATDERVTLNVVAEIEKKETYAERSFRIRSPSRRLSRYGSTVYAEFCLGAPVPLRDVVEHVINDLMNRKVLEDTLLARDAVYAVLRRDYPCEADDDE